MFGHPLWLSSPDHPLAVGLTDSCPARSSAARSNSRPANAEAQLQRQRGTVYLAGPLGEAAATAGRTRTRIGTRYRRLAKRRGKPKAQVATGNTLLRIAYALLAWV